MFVCSTEKSNDFKIKNLYLCLKMPTGSVQKKADLTLIDKHIASDS